MSLPPLYIYSLFHLNLAYSSIAEEQRSEVVACCYWPLLRLARQLEVPLAIEASAFTLETAAAIDPSWLAELRRLVSEGRCEFVGSGYAQLIGPLVPAEVNAANLRLGNDVYERLLGFRPQVALVNEQAYSAGIVGHYLDAGYQAIIMEWNNPARCHPEWNDEWRYLPQYALAADGRKIPLIWNNSICFQKFQRYAHGELDLTSFLTFFYKQGATNGRILPLYGNDVEIFDFRPGRYHTEAVIHQDGEWQRIRNLFEAVSRDESLELIAPSAILHWLDKPGAGNTLRLESAEAPLPVKKQAKYNITRWAVSGRDDLAINTSCWRIFSALEKSANRSDDAWRELCYLWSSDFRTHITDKRWQEYRERLHRCERRFAGSSQRAPSPLPDAKHVQDIQISDSGDFLVLESPTIFLRLNCRRGLAIDRLVFKGVSPEPVCGTLEHGYYDDILFGADFYSGHVVFESPGQIRVTDLSSVDPEIVRSENGELLISACVQTALGKIFKRISVCDGEVTLAVSLDWPKLPPGSLRVAAVTMNPTLFERDSLFFRTHNGGFAPEMFPLGAGPVDHGEATSFLVSARQALGVTSGIIEFGDRYRAISLRIDRCKSALVGLLSFTPIRDSYFARLSLSASEMDETCRSKELAEPIEVSVTLTAYVVDKDNRDNQYVFI